VGGAVATVRRVDLHLEYPYEAPADVVFAMFTDHDFILAKLEAAGALAFEIVDCSETPDGGYCISTKRTMQAEIPAFARKIFNPTQALHQIEDWEAEVAGNRPGEWRVETTGVPVKTGGITRLEATDDGCVHHIEGRIKVSVPLIGGRLERFVFDQAKATTDTEHTFGQQWLAEHA
jgi:hypothetical protein